MNRFYWVLLTFFVFNQATLHGQRLRKADRQIAGNIQNHLKNLESGSTLQARAQYIADQFARQGLKPMGDSNTYFQRYAIYEGKEIGASTSMSLNGKKLKLHEDYFPFAFSANKSAEAAVAIALAENGVPWFKDISELLEGGDQGARIDTSAVVRKKAMLAAEKGASALILYSSQDNGQLIYNKFDRSKPVPIPVLFLNRKVFQECCSDESAIIDVSLTVNLKENNRTGINVIGFADNRGDSISMAVAPADTLMNAAALIEVARLAKSGKGRKNSLLFITYCDEKNGTPGAEYYRLHPVVDYSKINNSVNIDTVTVSNNEPKGLYLVKQSVDLLKN